MVCTTTFAGGSKLLTEEQKQAYKKLIESSACAYVSLSHLRVTPKIFLVPSACSKKNSKPVGLCFQSVLCANQVMPVMIDSAVCWAKSEFECPDAKTCALDTFLGSVEPEDWTEANPKLNNESVQGVQ